MLITRTSETVNLDTLCCQSIRKNKEMQQLQKLLNISEKAHKHIKNNKTNH